MLVPKKKFSFNWIRRNGSGWNYVQMLFQSRPNYRKIIS